MTMTAGTRTSWPLTLTAFAVGLAIGGALMLTLTRGTDVETVRGTVLDVSSDGAAIDLDIEDGEYTITPMWQGTDGSWRTAGRPSCLVPGARGAEVELGTVDVTHEEAPSTTATVWIKCLRDPTG